MEVYNFIWSYLRERKVLVYNYSKDILHWNLLLVYRYIEINIEAN